MDRRDSDGFFSMQGVCIVSDSTYNTTDLSLIADKLLGFLRVSLLICYYEHVTWYCRVLCNCMQSACMHCILVVTQYVLHNIAKQSKPLLS